MTRINLCPSAPSRRWDCAWGKQLEEAGATAKPAPASAAVGVKATRLADNPSDTSPTAQSGNFNYARSAGARGVANGGNHAPSLMRRLCQRHVSPRARRRRTAQNAPVGKVAETSSTMVSTQYTVMFISRSNHTSIATLQICLWCGSYRRTVEVPQPNRATSTNEE